MKGFWNTEDGLEARLRGGRPEPRDELVNSIVARVDTARRPVRRGSFRFAFAGVTTAGMLAALALVGGLGYAATGVTHAVHSVVHLVAPAHQHGVLTIAGATSGGDQYKPGFGWGDDNHNHEGPPGLTRKGGNLAPPLQSVVLGVIQTIATTITLDEQAHLTISVIDPASGKKISIAQNKSKLGNGLKGKATKNLQYLVTVPRAINLQLALPNALLKSGQKYTIKIQAKDPQGNIKILTIPFIAA